MLLTNIEGEDVADVGVDARWRGDVVGLEGCWGADLCRSRARALRNPSVIAPLPSPLEQNREITAGRDRYAVAVGTRAAGTGTIEMLGAARETFQINIHSMRHE